MKKLIQKIILISVILCSGCAYQFVCGDGNTTTQPKTVDTSPEIQGNVPISQGAATVSGSSQIQTKPIQLPILPIK